MSNPILFEADNIIVYKFCLKMKDQQCKHDVIFGGNEKMMTAQQIDMLLKKNGHKVPIHFKRQLKDLPSGDGGGILSLIKGAGTFLGYI